ncbi:hypothetical protein, partial [Pseudolysinimonas sp.]
SVSEGSVTPSNPARGFTRAARGSLARTPECTPLECSGVLGDALDGVGAFFGGLGEVLGSIDLPSIDL